MKAKIAYVLLGIGSLIFLVHSTSHAEKGLLTQEEGWGAKREDATAGGAIRQKTKVQRADASSNDKMIRQILINPYQTTEHQKIKVGEFLGEEIWYDPRIRPTRCLQNAMESHNLAKTPEPSSLSLFLAGGAVLIAGRRRRV